MGPFTYLAQTEQQLSLTIMKGGRREWLKSVRTHIFFRENHIKYDIAGKKSVSGHCQGCEWREQSLCCWIFRLIQVNSKFHVQLFSSLEQHPHVHHIVTYCLSESFSPWLILQLTAWSEWERCAFTMFILKGAVQEYSCMWVTEACKAFRICRVCVGQEEVFHTKRCLIIFLIIPMCVCISVFSSLTLSPGIFLVIISN